MKRISLIQLDSYINKFRGIASLPAPKSGWIKAIRKAVGMSEKQLAKRLNISQQTLARLEKSEEEGRIILNTLNKAAEALGCRVVYALVPEKPLLEMVEQEILRKASERLTYVNHSMKLEDQAISEEMQKHLLQEIVNELKAGSCRQLWD